MYVLGMIPLYHGLCPKEELQSTEEARVNKVSVRKTSLATPKGNSVRCRTISPFAGSRHYISIR